MTSNFTKTLLISAMAALVPLSAQAHRTWLLPSSTVLDGKEPWVTVDAAVSEDLFDFDTNAQKLDVLEVFGPDGAAVKPENMFTGRLRSSFDLKLAKPGTYKIGMVRESAMVSYKLGGELKRWRGDEKDMAKDIPANAEEVQLTRQHARQETFVTADKSNDVVLKKLSGVGIELVPLTHPNELFAGETARFRLLLDGKPLANHLLGVVPGGVRYRGVLNEIPVSTDTKGEFSVKWPSAGMYWLSANWPARGDGPPVMVPRRVSYSATLEVLPQ